MAKAVKNKIQHTGGLPTFAWLLICITVFGAGWCIGCDYGGKQTQYYKSMFEGENASHVFWVDQWLKADYEMVECFKRSGMGKVKKP